MTQHFIEMCMRTRSEITSPQLSFDETHALMGMVDEGMEFAIAASLNDLPNVIEEIGDFLWFTALFTHATGITIEPIEPEYPIIPLRELGNIIGCAKRLLAYSTADRREQLDKIRVTAGLFLWSMLSVLVANTKHDFESARALCEKTVLEKLKVRYPSKFSSRLALERDLNAEREVLENATKH